MNNMKRIIETAGGILYRWKDGAEPTRVLSPLVESNIATDSTIIANTADSDDETTTAPGASDVAFTPDPAWADNPTIAGNVLNRIEPCIVHRLKYGDWNWPRGKVDPNESHRHTAVREIGEGLGLPMELGPYLGDIEYPLSEEGRKRRHTRDRLADTKHIQFWMATPVSATDNLRYTHAFGPVRRVNISETDEVLWLTPAEARKKLSHSTDKDILALFVDRVQKDVLDAMPVTIACHGKAKVHRLWKGSDANRPITPRGVTMAYALNRELTCFNPARLATSPWVRCQKTLEMLVWQTERDMIHSDPLTEDAHATASGIAWERLLGEIEFAFEHRQPTAVCARRPAIGGIFGHLRSTCVVSSLSKRLIAKTPFTPTGMAVTLFVTPTSCGPKIIDIQKVQPLVY